MILTFSEPKFEERILNGWKGTTFREDKNNRWKVGMIAHMWMHNPRNVQLNPHHIKNDLIYNIHRVVLNPVMDYIQYYYDEEYKCPGIKYTATDLHTFIDTIASSDGFEDWKEMKEWFIKRGYTNTEGYRMKRLLFKSFYNPD